MYNEKKMYYIKAITPIHAGSGQGLETVDMPIQRERHTNIPKIESSSLKGSIKSWIKRSNDINHLEEAKNIYEILGKDENADSASRAAFTEARLLYFPIKSNQGVFKLVTCPYILNRWFEDISIKVNSSEAKNNAAKKVFNIKDTLIHDDKYIDFSNNTDKIFLEEYIFDKQDFDISEYVDILPLAQDYQDRIVIIKNDVFIDLVTMYTEIITRNRIGESGTAEETGLFTEEFLPPETIMYFNVFGSPSFVKKKNNDKNVIKFIDKYLKNDIFQIGGDATIGKGFVKVVGTEV